MLDSSRVVEGEKQSGEHEADEDEPEKTQRVDEKWASEVEAHADEDGSAFASVTSWACDALTFECAPNELSASDPVEALST